MDSLPEATGQDRGRARDPFSDPAGTWGLTFDPSPFLPGGSGQSPSHQDLEALSSHRSGADVTEVNQSVNEKNNI